MARGAGAVSRIFAGIRSFIARVGRPAAEYNECLTDADKSLSGTLADDLCMLHVLSDLLVRFYGTHCGIFTMETENTLSVWQCKMTAGGIPSHDCV